MKLWSRTLLAGVLAATAPAVLAQHQPVMSVDITHVTVYTGDSVESIELISGGSGYTTAPAVVISAPGSGVTAQAIAQVSRRVVSIRVTNGGSNYTEAPDVIIAGSGGATAVATIDEGTGQVVSVTVTNGGSGYGVVPPGISFTGGGGGGAAAEASVDGYVSEIIVTNPGSGYAFAPTVEIDGDGDGAGASAYAALSGVTYNPPNERSGPAGRTIGITAKAVGTFVRDSFRYSFFVNGVSIGRTTDPIPPPQDFTIPWTPPQPGFYFLTVTADDGTNSATSLPIRYFATGTVVNSPVTNTIVPSGSSVVLKADSTVGGGFIRSIQFYDNGQPIGDPDPTIPYSLIYTPPGGPGTVHNITAIATDNDFNLLPASAPVVLNVVNAITPLPRAVITTPAHNSAVEIPTAQGATIPVVVDASSSSGVISKVELYIDGVLFGTSTTFPYTFNWRPSVVGLYRLVALAYDDKNNVVASTTSTTSTSTPRPTWVTVETQTSEAASARVYRGSFTAVGGGASSTLPVVTLHRGTDGNATMIAFAGGTTPSIHFHEGVEVSSDGSFTVNDGATAEASGMFSATGVSGQFDAGQAAFVAPLVTGTSAYQGTGRISGTISGRPSARFVGIVGSDGGLTIYVRDGDTEDAGHGTIRGSGSFSFPTVRGGTFEGQIGPSGGILTGTLTGPVAGTVSAVFEGAAEAASDGFLVNLSARGPVGTGARQLIAGFIVAEDEQRAPKQVLIRGIGPSLSKFNVSRPVAGPSLTLMDRDGTALATNTRWGGGAAIKAASTFAGAFALEDSSQDASLLQTLTPGAYTVQMGSSGDTGLGLVEIYDVDLLDQYAGRRILNLSTRGYVGQGQDVIIAGFAISGTKPKRILVRGVGPTLTSLPGWPGGELSDPVLSLNLDASKVLRTNDDWHRGNNPDLVRQLSNRVGAFALRENSKDAVILITLPPGSYTAQLSGAGGATGIALMEVYEVD